LRRIAIPCVVALALLCSSARAEELTPRFPDVSVQTAAGLIPLPLESTRYHVDIVGRMALVRLTQVWRSPFREAVDARYLGALPPRAALSAIHLRVGDRLADGVLESKAQADRDYAAARARGNTAAMVAVEPGRYQQAIANVRPAEHVEVELEFLVELDESDAGVELTLPLVAAPQRGIESGPPRLPEAIRWVHRASVEVHVAGAGVELRSPTHTIEVVRGADSSDVTLRGGARIADRDFILQASLPTANKTWAHRTEGMLFGAVTVRTPSSPPHPREHVLVIDEAALRVSRTTIGPLLDAMVARVPVGDSVRLVHGTSISRPLPPAQLSRVIASVQPTSDASMSTTMRLALRGASKRNVVVVTDGNSSDLDQLPALLLESKARVSFAGVGPVPDRARLARLARLGHGALAIAVSGDDHAGDRLGALWSPAYDKLQIVCDSRVLSQEEAPNLPAVTAAHAFIQVAIRSADCTTLALRLHTADETSSEIPIPVEVAEPAMERLLELGWARERLLALTEADASSDEAFMLSLHYNLASEGTRFVVVDHDARGIPARRLVMAPLPMPFDPPPTPRGTFSTDQIRPGDPEVRIEAPLGTRRVTLLLPSGELIPCAYAAHLDRWVANFLIADDRRDGIEVVHVLLELADGRSLRRTLRYQVDAQPPDVDVALARAEVHPGDPVELRVVPRVNEHVIDVMAEDIGDPTFAARVRDDVAVVVALWPDGTLHRLERDANAEFRITLPAPSRPGRYEIAVSARDGARNVRRVVVTLDVH
jgi:Vault protein inter-alpha-trypsin domain